MTAIKTAIQDAIRGGWRPPFILHRVELEVGFGELFYQMYAGVFLNPLFWQALFKDYRSGLPFNIHLRTEPQWKQQWHRFIDHLIAEKTAESFFKSL